MAVISQPILPGRRLFCRITAGSHLLKCCLGADHGVARCVRKESATSQRSFPWTGPSTSGCGRRTCRAKLRVPPEEMILFGRIVGNQSSPLAFIDTHLVCAYHLSPRSVRPFHSNVFAPMAELFLDREGSGDDLEPAQSLRDDQFVYHCRRWA